MCDAIPMELSSCGQQVTHLVVAVIAYNMLCRAAQVTVPQVRRRAQHQLRRTNMVVMSFDDDASQLLHSLAMFCPRGSQVTLVCQ